MAYPVYLLLLAISSAGIPIAISIIVSGYLAKDDYRSVRRVFSVSLRLMACVGAVLALLLFIAANYLVDSDIIRDGRAYYALIALIPAIFFATILATFRGFFQGHQLMTPPAVSQIIEQFIRVVTMVLFSLSATTLWFRICCCRCCLRCCSGKLDWLDCSWLLLSSLSLFVAAGKFLDSPK